MNKVISIIDHVGQKAGMDYYSGSLAKGFIENDCSVTVYSNFSGIYNDKILYKLNFQTHTKDNKAIKFTKFVWAVVKSAFYAKKQNSDLVIMHLFSANIPTLLLVAIPKFIGLKVALIAHDISSFVNNDNRFFQYIIYNKLTDIIIVHNKFSYATLLNKTIKIENPTKVKVVKHGGYLDYINKKQDKLLARKELGLDKEGKYILFFGQIKDVKGLDLLLNALSQVDKSIKLIIAGKPWKSDFSKYDALIDQLNLENRIIKKIKFIDDNEREKLFFASDVNVLPYRIIYQSGVLLMAMSYGLPVIASDLPSNREIINDGDNGLLFKNKDISDLANKINYFFEKKDLPQSLSEKALVAIQKEYSWKKIAKNYISLINNF